MLTLHSKPTTACYARVDTELGRLLLVGERACEQVLLRGVYFDDAPHAARATQAGAREDASAFADVCRQLGAYLGGEQRSFELSLDPLGTEFQRRVWRALAAIPYGTTTTYAEIARRIGNPSAVRAVGAANGKNPLSIVVPCHRVIGADGTLTGYAGGLAAKRRLLELERATLRGRRPSDR